MIRYSIEALLRPYPEAVNPAGNAASGSYQGTACTTPIMFTEGGQALDPLAGQTGYSPLLARALPVPMGSRIILWLPTVWVVDAGGVPVAYYKWVIAWRLRSAQDLQVSAAAGAFHMGAIVDGRADGTTIPASPRFGIPAAWQTLTYVPTEPAPVPPTAIGNRAVSGLHPEDVYAGGGLLAQPKLPGTASLARLQQGVTNPADTYPGAATFANMPSWIPHEVVALGDELLVGCYRDTTLLDANWDFTAAHSDRWFGQLFSGTANPQMGVRVFVGVIG